MKSIKIFRTLGIATLLALLIVAIPVAPAQAATMSLSTTSGSIGDQITVTGSGFGATVDPNNPQTVIVYFSQQSATIGQTIGTNVTVYKTILIQNTNSSGVFTGTFTVPDKITVTQSVTAGTYYLYACQLTGANPDLILVASTFTVAGTGAISINPSSGPVDTEIQITGSDFGPSSSIAIDFGGVSTPIERGNTTTNTNGAFTSYILVPESTAGTHTVRATVAGTSASAQFTITPEIFLGKTSAEAGTQVSIEGTGFGRRKDVTIWFNNAGIATALSGRDGSFDLTITIPELAAGIYDVEAEDEDGNLDSAKFTIFQPAPPPEPTPEPTPEPEPPTPTPSAVSGSLSPADTGPVGMDLIVTGTGFTAGKEVTIQYDGEEIATGTATPDGIIVAVFQVPESDAGDHTITASDGTNTLELTFTIESEPPEIPVPLKPEMGVQAKTPILFDWQEVTDASTPVTYILQVATDEDFTESSIVLEKKQLTKSEYTLTDDESKKLVEGEQTNYYWRVRATDAAANESDWTGAGEFMVDQPFSLPSWAVYTLIGLGGLLLFGIGYLLGRRTAFYY